MWGLALAHVTVTQSGSSCCQGIEGWKEGRRTTEAEFKGENRRKCVGQQQENICKSPISGTVFTLTLLSDGQE